MDPLRLVRWHRGTQEADAAARPHGEAAMSPQPFPHLLPAESILWAVWLRDHAADYDRFVYDVRVGGGRPVDITLPPEIQEMARTLTKKRIDAVGYQGTTPTIFEVSPRAGLKVYGGIQLYGVLYRDTFTYTGPLNLAVVVEHIDPDIDRQLRAIGVTVYVVSPAPREPVPPRSSV